ncbi:hypothetical protein [Paenibacillus anseongensis]|nr:MULTISPECIES: hypothetical protein [Paenibacillus]
MRKKILKPIHYLVMLSLLLSTALIFIQQCDVGNGRIHCDHQSWL